MADFIFNQFKGILGDGTIDWNTIGNNYIKVLLVADGSATPDKDVDNLGSGFTEATGGTYVRKAVAQAGRTVTVDDTNDRALYDVTSDITWTALSFTNGTVVGKTKAAILFYDPAGAAVGSETMANCVPLVWWDFVVQTNGGDVTLQFSNSPAAAFAIT